jgi:hypothetical protein
MGIDLDRLERLAGGLAVLFYALLFLAFLTAVMGSGGGGLLLLALGAAAHVGRVGLEDFVERRRELGDVGMPGEEDAGERATGLRLKWMPSQLRLPRRIDLGGIRARAAELGAGRGSERARGMVAGSGEAAGAALGRVAAARADLRASFAALVAEIRERPAGAPRRSFDLPHQDLDDEPGPDLFDGGFDEELDFADAADNFAVTDSRYEDFEMAEDSYEDFAVAASEYEDLTVAEHDGEFEGSAGPDLGFEPELVADFDPDPPAARQRREPAPRSGAPTAQERYEARQRARAERGEAEPIVAAVEVAETRQPQRVQRRQPGGRPDPLRTRRPTRSF